MAQQHSDILLFFFRVLIFCMGMQTNRGSQTNIDHPPCSFELIIYGTMFFSHNKITSADLSAVKTISRTARSLPPPPPVFVPFCVLAQSASSLLSVKAPMLLPSFQPPSSGNNQFIEIILANEILFNIFLSPAMTIHTCWYSPNQTL
jgi:hypothetical protein